MVRHVEVRYDAVRSGVTKKDASLVDQRVWILVTRRCVGGVEMDDPGMLVAESAVRAKFWERGELVASVVLLEPGFDFVAVSFSVLDHSWVQKHMLLRLF